MTKEEFEVKYAEENGITVEEMRSRNWTAVPCHCGQIICKGWKMLQGPACELLMPFRSLPPSEILIKPGVYRYENVEGDPDSVLIFVPLTIALKAPRVALKL